MNEVARLVGMEPWSYEKDGKQRQFCGLHFVYLKNSQAGVNGSKVEFLLCPQEVDLNWLKLGSLYELQFSKYTTLEEKIVSLTGLGLVIE